MTTSEDAKCISNSIIPTVSIKKIPKRRTIEAGCVETDHLHLDNRISKVKFLEYAVHPSNKAASLHSNVLAERVISLQDISNMV